MSSEDRKRIANSLAAIIFSLGAFITLVTKYGYAGTSASTRMSMLAFFGCQFVGLVTCGEVLQWLRTGRRVDILTTPIVCVMVPIGISTVINLFIGRDALLTFQSSSDVYAAHVLWKIRDALLGGSFLAVAWLTLVERKYSLAIAIPSALVSFYFLGVFALLP